MARAKRKEPEVVAPVAAPLPEGTMICGECPLCRAPVNPLCVELCDDCYRRKTWGRERFAGPPWVARAGRFAKDVSEVAQAPEKASPVAAPRVLRVDHVPEVFDLPVEFRPWIVIREQHVARAEVRHAVRVIGTALAHRARGWRETAALRMAEDAVEMLDALGVKYTITREQAPT